MKNPSPFSKKMNTLALAVIACGMVFAAPIVWSSAGKPSTTIIFLLSRAIEIAVWLYLSAILLQLYKHTQLREYILNAHSFWLAGIIAYPLTLLFSGILLLLGNIIQSSLYTLLSFFISGTWLVLAIVGKVLSQRRANQYNSEILNNSTIWVGLLRMDYKSIALLKFPRH